MVDFSSKRQRRGEWAITAVVVGVIAALALVASHWDDRQEARAQDWPQYRCRTFYQSQERPAAAWQTVKPLVRC